ncbi:DNA polymerase [Brevibacillus agri]|uniref:DNA polymerase n=1 Tax=Brevibacillus agri TaxID=51101 RepID=UPI001EE58B33|nr:DNA polymerase [Brevibacillus agri]MCG5252587.1 DNA polymerase [Brevibacillus agri]
MNVTLRLNLRSPTAESEEAAKRVEAAVERKKAAETIEQAWERILSMKNSPTDQERLLAVKHAMESGILGGYPTDGKRFSKAEALRLWAELNERQRGEKLAEMVRNTPANYRLIQTVMQMDALVADLANESIIAVDTETTGLDYYDADVIVGVSLTLPNANYHVYIPVGHDEGEQLAREYVLGRLRPYLEDEGLGKVLHNYKFDAHMFIKHGIRMRGLRWDTQIAMHLLNENEPSYALKNLATRYLKEPSDTFERLFGKSQFNTIPLDVALVYAAKDTDLTWRMYQFQRAHFGRLPKLLDVYERIENPLIDVVLDMERTGFVLDAEHASKLGEDLRGQLADVERQLAIHFGDINYNSHVQLKPAIEALVREKIDSTDVKTLKALQDRHDAVRLLLKYRELTKLLGTYVEALPQQVRGDGRIHANFNQAATVTGRFSSNNPNFQNQPKYARKMFVAPPGMVILSGDFSQQEPRLLAHFSGEPVLIEAYRAGKDLYTTAAAELFGLPESECGDGSKYRKMLKTGILAVMYGTGPKTLAGQLEINEKEARDFIAQFYAKYPNVKAWIDGNERFAKKHGYIEMLYGRKRRLPEAISRDRSEQFRALRQATNAIIQGSAAIQTKLTMIALDSLCKRRGWQMAFSIHDEIGLYAPKDITLDDVREFESVMLNTVTLTVPNKTDIEISERWGEGKNVKEWFALTK